MNNHRLLTLLVFLVLLIAGSQACVHDHIAHNTTKHFYNDLSNGRRLQAAASGRMRIFVDYTQLTTGGPTEINTIKRIVNITASYFYNVLNVTRLDRLFFPANTSKQCNVLTIPDVYVQNGTIGDLGVVCGNQNNQNAIYVAKSSACAFLQSNNRPIWGMMQFNNAFLKYDQEGFQQILFVGMHEMTHILGFSALMYSMYPGGNPLIQQTNGDYFLSSPRLRQEAVSFFNCTSAKGMLLQDQDGTLISSHWQRKIVGNEFMIASNKKGAFVSRFTLALFQSTGWYPFVNYTFAAEPTTWGRGKGCNFFNIDNCDFPQFCTGSDFTCDWEGTAIGRCNVDTFTGSCKMVRYFTNTICVDENYQLKNLNSKLNAMERGGSSSKCFISDFRDPSVNGTLLNNRCYVSVCSSTGRFVFILVGQYILVCRVPGQKIPAPVGLTGTLTCPSNFDNYCSNKQNCPYHCNQNGACINGQCLCTGTTILTPSCLDVSIYDAPIGNTGGLLQALNNDNTNLVIDSSGSLTAAETKKPTVVKYSINNKCQTGSVFDPIFGQCLKCIQTFNCNNCDQNGCISCNNPQVLPIGGKCLAI